MKYLYGLIGVLLIIIGGIYITGYFLPVEHKVMQTREFQVPRAAIWEKITSLEDFTEWRSSVDSVVIRSDSGKALTWTEYYQSGDRLTFRETERIDTVAFSTVIIGEDLPFGGTWTIALQSVATDQTRVTISENGEIYSPVFRFFSRFVFGYQDSINEYFRDLQSTM